MSLKTTTVMLTLLIMSVWLLNCTDVPSTGPPVPEFNAEFRFINAAEDLGDVGVSVDGASVGTAAYLGEIAHRTFLAGSRVVDLGSGDSQLIGMETDQRGSVVILPLTGATREFLKLNERRIFDSAATSTARFRVTNAVIDTVQIRETVIDTTVTPPDTSSIVTGFDIVGLSIDVTVSSADTMVAVSGLGYAQDTGYMSIPPGDYTVDISEAGVDSVITSTSVSLSLMRQSAVIMGSVANGTQTAVDFVDN